MIDERQLRAMAGELSAVKGVLAVGSEAAAREEHTATTPTSTSGSTTSTKRSTSPPWQASRAIGPASASTSHPLEAGDPGSMVVRGSRSRAPTSTGSSATSRASENNATAQDGASTGFTLNPVALVQIGRQPTDLSKTLTKLKSMPRPRPESRP